MNKLKILEKLKLCLFAGNHFVFSTDQMHSSTYVNKYAIYSDPVFTSNLCKMIANKFRSGSVDTVIGPERGGTILSQWVAYYLSISSGVTINAIYAKKKENSNFFIENDYTKLVVGKRVLIVDDTLTTGTSVKKIVGLVRSAGCKIVGVDVLWNRGNVKAEDVGLMITPLCSLIDIYLETFSKEDCAEHGPCSKGIPVNTEYGHGAEFLARKIESSKKQTTV